MLSRSPSTDASQIPSEVQNILDMFIFNELPTHLLYVPRLKITKHSEVKRHFRLVVPSVGGNALYPVVFCACTAS
ncbi:hypothetical protein BV22DRAFT_1029940 [Leucogyrophana mollusca]|uniref:Uncharacterized protein n=1 Tax=Leucogyrophana mollusca TaxID=85980 RepID=A0ACB8BUJ1_9AGAM|nr:hypothetical protein BV22DRAFT_1029940 [Leucogyrophana mollusca]